MAPSTRKGKGRSVTTAAELAAAGELDADSDFAFPSLSALDSSLRCAICSELYTAPVLLTHCGHSFDSRCLAQHFVVKRSCPTCHREAFHDHTVRNQALSELVESWRAARSDLLQLQAQAARNATPEAGHSRGLKPTNGETESHDKDRTRSATTKDGKRKAASSSSPVPRAVKREKFEDASSDIEILEEIPVDRKPAKRPRTRRRDPEQESTPPLAAADPTDPNLVVECPLCGRSLKNGLMSGHLDRCTGEPSSTTGTRPDAGPSQAWSKLMSTSTSNGSRSAGGSNTKDGSSSASTNAGDMDLSKKLPLGSYQHKKSAQLVKMLKDYGLPTDSPNGLSPEAKVTHLQRRHRQFVILWNANADLDSEHPARKTAKQLRTELRRWEDDQDRAEGKGEIAEDHAVKYAEQYRELIAQARATHEKAKKAKEEAAAQAPDTQRSKTPEEAAPPTTEQEKEATPPSREEDQPEQRKKSVRVVSPPPRSSPSPSPALIGTAERRGASDDSGSTGSSSSSPLLPSSPLLAASAEPDDDSEEERRSRGTSLKRRTPSPFDPAGPRPSQRNREEERMFAELYGDRAADESLQVMEEDSGT
ncbi:hypothetical protein C6P46_005960 [Rhodotorula mucilaginosa]|uniref:Postreplication repair E3 ubiquitin-protein ligase RAD18 n=1 Tax=Rhodotorula mucilaginosa TaxID=5537 RepID=A0A9P6W769_RHOMI|nr:hypothetical protein C6P46_005960 [Rhodotorula mucilaginosa]